MQALRQAMRNVFSREASFGLFLSLVLAWTSIVHFSPKTPIGTHCPTAAIQWLAAGPSHELRKPTLGEKAFVQCHCAEKKAAQKAIPQTRERDEWPVLTVLNPSRFIWQSPAQLASHRVITDFECALVVRNRPPLLRPPTPTA